MIKYKEFALGDLFEFELIQQAKSQNLIPDDNSINGIPYVVQMSGNNMISRKVNKQVLINLHEPPVSGNRLAIGMALPVVSYQPFEFGGSQLITLKSDKLNNFNGFYVATAIRLILQHRSYGQVHGINGCSNIIINLPVDNDDQPDWEYMTEYIQQIQAKYVKQIQAKYVKQIQAYLAVISDDTLDEQKTQAVLQQYRQSDFKEFRIGDLFEINTGSLLDSKTLIVGDIPRISTQSTNNGIIGYYDTKNFDNARHFKNFISISFFGQAFYHQSLASVDMKVHVLTIPHHDYDSNLGLYMTSVLNKLFNGKFGYGNQLSSSKLRDENYMISLPITSAGEPDYQLMRDYIKVIQQKYVDKLQAQLQQRLLTYQSLI